MDEYEVEEGYGKLPRVYHGPLKEGAVGKRKCNHNYFIWWTIFVIHSILDLWHLFMLGFLDNNIFQNLLVV